jgi:hypothetical protein
MSLLSANVSKVKRLSLKGVKLPAPTEPAKTTPSVERPPSDDELVYIRMTAKNPLIAQLVERLDLVSNATGERIKTVVPQVCTPLQPDKEKLTALIQHAIAGEDSYTAKQLIERIVKTHGVNPERAEKEFHFLVKAGFLALTADNYYYLTGSTPF